MNVVREEFDRILEVNGVRGNSVELAKALGILVFFDAQVELPNLGKMFFFGVCGLVGCVVVWVN